MRFLGVDTGVFGAIAALDTEGRALEVVPTPTRRDEKGRRVYDLDAFRPLLLRLMVGRPSDVFVTIEKIQAMPLKFQHRGDSAQGVETGTSGILANYNRGFGRGAWECAFAMLGVPRERRLLVRPQQWQREMLKGAIGDDTKAQSISRAKQLWPSVSLIPSRRARHESDGMSDGLLVAQFGRMVHLGGALFAATDRPAARNTDVFRRA